MSDHSMLTAWVAREVNLPNITLLPLTGDASFRAYYRLKTEDRSYIVMDASFEKQSIPSFLGVAAAFAQRGLPVPKIYSYDLSMGYVLLSDFGDQLLLPRLDPKTVEHWYAEALALLSPLQAQHASAYAFPHFDEARILRELSIFHEWCLDKLLNVQVSSHTAQLLNDVYTGLIDSALAQPQVTVHLDFHSRNLMIQPHTEKLGMIDFQDAVIGPITYDLVSLIKDCYIAWPDAQVAQWVESAYHEAIRQGTLKSATSLAQFHSWFEWMGLQRHLKVLGVFSRLKLRDNKSGYIKDMPRILRYVLNVTAKDPKLHLFDQFLRAEVQPRLEAYWRTQGVDIAA